MDEHSFDYPISSRGRIGNVIKFALVLGFAALFTYSLISAIHKTEAVQDGIKNAAKVRDIKRVNK